MAAVRNNCIRCTAVGMLTASAVLAFSCTPPPGKHEARSSLTPVKAPVRGEGRTGEAVRPERRLKPIKPRKRPPVTIVNTPGGGEIQLAIPERDSTSFPPANIAAAALPSIQASAARPASENEDRRVESPFGHPPPALPLDRPVLKSDSFSEMKSDAPSGDPTYQRGQLGQSRTAVFPPQNGLRRSRTFPLEVLFMAMVIAVLCGAAWYSLRYRDRSDFRGPLDRR